MWSAPGTHLLLSDRHSMIDAMELAALSYLIGAV